MAYSIALLFVCLFALALETSGGRRRDQSFYIDRWSSSHNIHVNHLPQRPPQFSTTQPGTGVTSSWPGSLANVTREEIALPLETHRSVVLAQETARQTATSPPLSTQVAAPSNMVGNSTSRRDPRLSTMATTTKSKGSLEHFVSEVVFQLFKFTFDENLESVTRMHTGLRRMKFMMAIKVEINTDFIEAKRVLYLLAPEVIKTIDPYLHEPDTKYRIFFPLFAFVTINNNACTAASGDNGTCYTASQCTSLGGSASGNCANGYGTCCVFQKTCGESSNNNCTYFVNTNYPKTFNGVSSCQLTINKKDANVCQLRIDFDIFMISQPEATDHVCLNDRFTVSGGDSVPTICGTNTGNHMYVNLGPGSTTPSVLTFVTMGPDFDRKWKVKVTQIPCNSNWTPPSGCLQYFQGVTGKIRSYNYDVSTGLQLSNQDYSMCIRTEKNFCGIQYQACTDSINTDSQAFTITGSTNNPIGSRVGASSCTTDWLTIPCVSDNAQNPFSNCQDRLCGDNINVVQSSTAGNVVVYSYIRPFRIVYHTDSAESSSTPSESGNRGFCLDYVQQPCA
ncbi:uncharacterized protein LOC143034597 [Oratosquilla oratoria]|uniref:uncharacterized protein LOC143034597 n=1 Tax=Oratosquilla oratoria TaxID=337810 RepID=UPI003F76BBEF